MRPYLLVVVAVASACTKAKEPRYDGPMPVQFGDCAGATVAFVSGPRPLPFTPAEAERAWEAPAKVVIAEPATPPDADVVAKEDDAGTAMALEEGKMGKKDEGHYRMRRADDDPQVARQQALEQARAAGVLGTAALVQGGAFASLTGTGDIASGFDDADIYGGLIGDEVGEMSGGFGRGGGGTGWGTIGTGRYGTIGHGTGTGTDAGYGRGGIRGRSATDPTVSIGQPNAQGSLDKAIIRRYIKRNLPKIQYCYEKQLLAKPDLAGSVMIQFFITEDGSVASSSGSGVDSEVASCVASVIKAIEFPKPKGGGGVQVNYPFVLRPAGQGAVPKTTAVGAGDSNGSGSAAEQPRDPPTAATGSAAATPAPAGATRRLYRSSELPRIDASKYRPGATNPLRVEEKALTECFREGPNHFGVVAVELTYDAAGNVTKVVPHGLQNEHARDCVVKVAKRVKREAAGLLGQRCSVAFGEMPANELAGVVITADAISLNDKPLTTLKAIEADEAKQIPSVVEAITARVTAASLPSGPVVLLHGPLAIKPLPETPMRIVDRVLSSVLAGNDDFVLATRKGASWQLVSPMTLPVVPVPFGTGDRWNHVKSKLRGAADVVDDERVVLSILLTKERIWVGLSRIMEFQELPADPSQAQKLAATLKAHKATPFFQDRSDVELAAEGDVPYEAFVNAIEAITAAGFTGWQYTDPNGLASRPTL